MTAAAALRYRLLLPPGWRQLSLGADRAGQLDGIIDELVDGVDERRVVITKWRLREEFLRQMGAAAADGGLDLFIPVQLLHGRLAAASFLVAELPVVASGAEPERETPLAVAALATRREGDGWQVEIRDLAGSTAVRSSRTELRAPLHRSGDDDAATPALDGPRETTSVEYVVQAPDARWLLFSFSAPVLAEDESPTGIAGMRFDTLLIELFDAIMTTLRWDTDAVEGPR